MKASKIILIGAALGLASVTAQAQSTDQLQQALAQAQAAAAQAQAAAKQAQAALEQALAAAYEARKSSASASAEPSAKETKSDGSLTVGNKASSVTLYGLIDVTLGYKNNANTADASGNRPSQFTPQVAWFSGNRWGITGSHATSSGTDPIRAIFGLESEFVANTGEVDTPNVLFNRGAWLGVQSDSLGKLTFGRQNALARDPAASAVYGDPYGPAKANLEQGGYTNTNNFKQLIFYAGTPNNTNGDGNKVGGTRIDNGIVWKKAFSNGLVAGMQYSFGVDPSVARFDNRGSSATGSLAFNGSNFTVAGFATSGTVASETLTDLNTYRHTAYSVGGNIQVSPLIRLNAGYFNYTAQQAAGVGDRNDHAWTLSAKVTPAGPIDFALGYQVMTASNAGTSGGFVLDAFRDMSGVKAATVASGDRSTFYGSVSYHLDSSTEFYLAADHLETTDTYRAAQAKGATSQNEFGLGMRYKF